MRPSWHLLLGAAIVLPSLLGCGSSQPVLDDPALIRCNESGPQAAPAPGKPLPAPVASAAPEPSAAPGGAPPAASAKGSADASSKPPRREIAVVTAETDPARLDGGVASPGTSPGKVPCGALFGGGSAFCVKAIEGPFVVTDLKMLPGCPNELFVAAGSSTSPRWSLLSTSAAPLAVHGSRLVIKPGEFLFVGAQAAKPEKISTDARCSMLWSGFRPYSGAADAAIVPRDLGF